MALLWHCAGWPGCRFTVLNRVLKSPAILATLGFAIGGVGFALAQLLFARALDPEDFAVVSLVLSMNQVGFVAAGLGIDVPINKHRIPASRALLRRTLRLAVPIAAGVGLVGLAFYRLDTLVAASLIAMVVASTANQVASALYRSTQQFVRGLLLTQLQNYALLFIAALALGVDAIEAGSVIALIVIAYGAGATIGWITLRRRDAAAETGPTPLQIREGLLAFGFSVAVMILVQFERLVIPARLSMADLALFSVAAALAASPFRMLQIGVGFTLLPRLRACRTREQVRSLLLREAAVVAAATAIMIVGVWLLAPYMLSTFLKGRYLLPNSLLIALFIVGTVRVASAFAVSSVQAMGEATDFQRMTVFAWFSIALGGTCALVGAHFGLHGVVYGVGIGWLALALAAALIAVRANARWIDRGFAPAIAKAAHP